MAKNYNALLENSRVWNKLENRLTAGISNSYTKDQMKVVLENTRQALLSDTMTQNITYLPKLVLPLVRRLFPKLIANNIISTQALQSPMGMIRFLDAYVVDKDGNRISNGNDGNVYPWGPGDNTYSTPPVEVKDDVTTGAITANGTLTATPSEGTLYLQYQTTTTTPITYVKFASVDRSGVVKKIDSVVVNNVALIGTCYGFVDPKTNKYVLTLDSDGNGTVVPTTKVSWVYKKDVQKNVVFNNSTTANVGDHKTMNTMQFDITKLNVETKTRKLGARYSFETMEDYKAEFGENFEDKMVDYLTTAILTEIDSETINMLSSAAKWGFDWDAQMPMTWTKGLNDWYATSMPVINKTSMTIYQNTHVQGASFIVCDPTTAIVFQGMMQYSSVGDPAESAMEVGSVKVGTLSGGMNIYVSPLVPHGELLMGFKGNSPESTGAIYAPYIPVQLQPIAYAEGMPAVMARTRYWMGVLRPDYYGKVTVANL